MLKYLPIGLLLIALSIPAIIRPAFAHNGIDHNNSCFLTVGGARLRISGYQFQPELEGKHFCHFYPGLGQTVVAVEPLEQGHGSTQVRLELARLTAWLHPTQAFTLIKQQPEQLLDTGLASISETIDAIGLYRLTVILNNGKGHTEQQTLTFLAGVPVTKILVIVAGGVFVLILGFTAVSRINKSV